MSINTDETLQLINDYISCSNYMCKILKEDYNVNSESLLRARRINQVPKEGILSEGYSFNFHGGGCFFKFDNSSIDVDFGPDDRCDGFDSQRLFEFLSSSNKTYFDLESEDDIKKSIEILIKRNILINPGWYPNPHLYYLNDGSNG